MHVLNCARAQTHTHNHTHTHVYTYKKYIMHTHTYIRRARSESKEPQTSPRTTPVAALGSNRVGLAIMMPESAKAAMAAVENAKALQRQPQTEREAANTIATN